MRIPRIKPLAALPVLAWYYLLGMTVVPDSWRLPYLGAEVLGVAWITYSFVVESPEEKAERELAASREKTVELEKDLGIEPMNLHELDEILLNNEKIKKEKES